MLGAREDVLTNLAVIRERIAEACATSGREPSGVQLVAVTKTVPIEAIRWVVEAGVDGVGENYVKELREKHDRVEGVSWHFIGTLQTNTAHHVAALADVVETLSGIHSSERLARRAAEAGRTIRALIEIDQTGERPGVAPTQAPEFLDRVGTMEGLKVVGLMTLPTIPTTAEDSRGSFVALRELRDSLRENHPGVVELSMGMSLDYPVAIEEGATIVRIGTALFGPRMP
jgi:PLP dependent protein